MSSALPACSREGVDYFAIYVFPEDVWYIFPAKRLAGMRSVALTPHLKGHKYERYMEGWSLLTRRHFCHGEKTVVPSDDKRLSSMSRLTRRIVERLEELDH